MNCRRGSTASFVTWLMSKSVLELFRPVPDQHAVLELEIPDGRERRRRRKRRAAWIRGRLVGAGGRRSRLRERRARDGHEQQRREALRLTDEPAASRSGRGRRGGPARSPRPCGGTRRCPGAGRRAIPTSRSGSPAAATAARVSTNRICGSCAACAGDPRVDRVHPRVLVGRSPCCTARSMPATTGMPAVARAVVHRAQLRR